MPGVFLQPGFEMFHVLVAELRLLGQPIKLRAEDGRLKFAEPVVKADDAVMELVGNAGASGVDVALHLLHVFEIVGDDRSASRRR